MYICVCKSVSDRRIRRAVEDGAVISLRDLSRELGVGTCCGKCVPAARALLDESCASLPLGSGGSSPAPLQAATA